MQNSLKSLVGFISTLSLLAGAPVLAQTTPVPGGSQTLPAPGSQTNPRPGIFNESPYAPSTPTLTPQVSVPANTQPMTIGQILRSSGSFEMLNALLPVAGLSPDQLQFMLNSSGSYTVFAPTDEAFAALPEGTIRMLVQPENRDLLIKILSYHVVPDQTVDSTQIRTGQINSVEGSPIAVRTDDATRSVRINQAAVLQPDIRAKNGVIHAINQVMIPPDAQSRLSLMLTPASPNSLTPVR